MSGGVGTTDASRRTSRPGKVINRSGPIDRARSIAGAWRRAAMRWGGRFGLVDPIRCAFGIKEVRDTDLFIVSYPRSGNTWTRYILAYLDRGVDSTIPYDELGAIVPDAYYSAERINATRGRRIIKIHEPFLEACPRVVYVHRDYRESLVSYWLFVRRFSGYDRSFSEFLHGPIPHEHGSWKEHIRALHRRRAADPDTIFVIAYDGLVADFGGTVGRLVEWSGIGAGVDISVVQQRTTLATLADEERRGGSAFNSRTGSHFYADSGRGMEWRSYWSADDLAWLARDRELVALMESLGYR
jgi:Sulfotransferase domain